MKTNLKSHRFKKKSISEFLKRSKKFKTSLFTMHYMENDKISYAFICPKRLGKATIRNKIRRQLKESFLKNTDKINSQMSIIFIAKENILDSSFKKIDDMILLSLKKKKLINEKN